MVCRGCCWWEPCFTIARISCQYIRMIKALGRVRDAKVGPNPCSLLVLWESREVIDHTRIPLELVADREQTWKIIISKKCEVNSIELEEDFSIFLSGDGKSLQDVRELFFPCRPCITRIHHPSIGWTSRQDGHLTQWQQCLRVIAHFFSHRSHSVWRRNHGELDYRSTSYHYMVWMLWKREEKNSGKFKGAYSWNRKSKIFQYWCQCSASWKVPLELLSLEKNCTFIFTSCNKTVVKPWQNSCAEWRCSWPFWMKLVKPKRLNLPGRELAPQ